MAASDWNTDIILGQDVVVNGISTLGKIKIDNRSTKSPMLASNLQGGADRPEGIRELQGYYWAWGDTPPVFPNDLFDLRFTLDGNTAVEVVNGSVAGIGVRCRAIEIFAEPFDPKQDNMVYYLVHFGGAGNDFSTSATVPTDTSAPVKYSTRGLGLQLDDATVCYIAGMHLKIQALAEPDWSSCLNGIAYFPAGPIDWSFNFAQRVKAWPQPATPGSLVYPDLDGVKKIYMATQTNADLSFKAGWTLEYGKLGRKSGEFDHKSRTPMTVEYLMEKSSLAADLGSIVDPAGVTQWP